MPARPASTASNFRYRLLARGDVNGFFALSIDNLALLAGMSGILISVFHMPADIVLQRMVPGTAFGVMIGDLLYTWLAYRLANRESRQDVCAMPLGIDTPSMFALSFGVVGPAFLVNHDAHQAWVVGMAVLFIMGAAKIAVAFFGEAIRRALPRTALLGALSAVAIALIMFFSFTKIIDEPIGGLVALGLVLLVLVGGIKLPWRVPAVAASVLVALLIYHLAILCGYAPPVSRVGNSAPGLMLPFPSLAFIEGLSLAWHYIPLAIPVALATVIGGIDNTESAIVAGDAYSTRSILLVEGIATLVAALCGGVIQNTPYIGHSAFKDMGSRAGYTLVTGLFIGVGAATGLIGALISVLPESVVVPVLVFVGMEMSEQAVLTASRRHMKAIGLALVPALAYLINIELGSLIGAAHVDMAALDEHSRRGFQVLTMLGNGFIITAMLWATWLIWVIDHRLRRAAVICAICAAMTLIGLIHSPFSDGRIFLPWQAGLPPLVYSLTIGYLLLGSLCGLLSLSNRGLKVKFPEQTTQEHMPFKI
jgi:AGZA family xanthine/uracil permease-like MFS transporter